MRQSTGRLQLLYLHAFVMTCINRLPLLILSDELTQQYNVFKNVTTYTHKCHTSPPPPCIFTERNHDLSLDTTQLGLYAKKYLVWA